MRPVEGDAYADLEPPSHRPTCSSRYERIGVGRGGATVRGLSWATVLLRLKKPWPRGQEDQSGVYLRL